MMDLGVTLHILGNIMWHSVVEQHWGANNIDDNVALLEMDLRKWEKRTRSEHKLQGSLTKERLRNSSGFPKLKAKGAQSRHLAPYALHLALEMDDGTDSSRLIVAVAQLLVEFYDLLAGASEFFTQTVAEKFHCVCFNMMLIYAELSVLAANSDVKAWKFIPKMHLLQHLPRQADMRGNPSYSWCYADEDLVGMAIDIAQGSHWSTVEVTALVKWLICCFDTES